jgi:hypothetical protein
VCLPLQTTARFLARSSVRPRALAPFLAVTSALVSTFEVENVPSPLKVSVPLPATALT